jgi:cellulose synthase/poly-beta-1,6-N-acetylglucosamine synthase-like glycosyltransferase
MLILAGFTLVFVILLVLIGLFRITFFWIDHRKAVQVIWPTVSILVAARDEEVLLPRLLQSLERLDYPNELLTFYLIDDQSGDGTGLIITDWCSNHQNRKSFKSKLAPEDSSYKNGKAAALDSICAQANGEFLFFTDADCKVNSKWIKEGVSCFDSDTGIVIGVTKVQATSVFGKFQELEWWNALTQVKIAADLGFQTTGLGNNMIIRKIAYDKSGGFGMTTKSLTEDLEISRLIHQTGFKFVHQISPQILSFTKEESGLVSLMNQRKRWLSGVLTLPVPWLMLLNLQFLFLPAVFLISYYIPWLGILLFLIKAATQGVQLILVSSRVDQKINWLYVLFFDFYSFLINVLTILYYIYPSKIRWKSRSY